MSRRGAALTVGTIGVLAALPPMLPSSWLLVMFMSFLWLILTANYDVLDGFLVIGLNPYRLSRILFTLAIVATAISGAFYVLAVPLNPYEGLPLTLKSFTVVILAGVGNLPATLVAGALLGLAEVATSQFIGSVWAPAVSLAVLFLVLVVKPTGLFGKGIH